LYSASVVTGEVFEESFEFVDVYGCASRVFGVYFDKGFLGEVADDGVVPYWFVGFCFSLVGGEFFPVLNGPLVVFEFLLVELICSVVVVVEGFEGFGQRVGFSGAWCAYQASVECWAFVPVG